MTREGSKPVRGKTRSGLIGDESPVGATDAVENSSISRTPTMTTPNELAGLIEACRAVANRFDESYSPHCVERMLGDKCREALKRLSPTEAPEPPVEQDMDTNGLHCFACGEDFPGQCQCKSPSVSWNNIRAALSSSISNAEKEGGGLTAYDAGLLNDFGGGNVEWWQDYIRAELGRAHDFYESQFAAQTTTATEDSGQVVQERKLVAAIYEHFGNRIPRDKAEAQFNRQRSLDGRLDGGPLMKLLRDHRLAARQSPDSGKPVAWLYDGPDGEHYIREHRDVSYNWLVKNGWTETPLLASLSNSPSDGEGV